jgi:hypothetical protein
MALQFRDIMLIRFKAMKHEIAEQLGGSEPCVLGQTNDILNVTVQIPLSSDG